MRVFVTRPASQAAVWVRRLRTLGVDAHALPLMAIAAPADTAAVQAAWQRLDEYQLVMFVSPNAVEQFFALKPPGVEWPGGLRAASPGPGTSEALSEAGIAGECIIAPPADAPQFDSEALWAVLGRDSLQGARVLIVRGGDEGNDSSEGNGRAWLADTLRSQGAQVEFLAAYRRTAPSWDVAHAELLREASAVPAQHLWLLSSSESIAHLVDQLAQRGLGAPGPDWTAVATHPRIAERAREAGFGRVLSSAPGFGAVASCIASAPTPPSIQSAAAPAAPKPDPAVNAAAPLAPPVEAALPSERVAVRQPAWLVPLLLLALIGIAASLWLAWSTQQRVQGLEQELVRRQQDSQGEATEARVLAKQAQDISRETAAKAALLEARVAEVALQRGQLEELIKSLSRSRDENLVVDIDAAVRVSLQQSALTGSAEPLVAALRSADERLARVSQPRLEGVRRAIARDLDRVKAVGVVDISTLLIKVDEVARLVDELPLASMPSSSSEGRVAPAAKPSRSARAAAAASAVASAPAGWPEQVTRWWGPVWVELRSLVRVTRIDAPEAMLVSPEQSFFLRENLKLKLLNARLALLSRQFDIAQSDLQASLVALGRYFDGGARKTATAAELLRQVASQSRQTGVPRPDDTLAALATAAAGR